MKRGLKPKISDFFKSLTLSCDSFAALLPLLKYLFFFKTYILLNDIVVILTYFMPPKSEPILHHKMVFYQIWLDLLVPGLLEPGGQLPPHFC